MTHSCKCSISEVEAGVSEVQGQYWLHETSQEGQGKGGRKGGEGRGEEGSSFSRVLGGLVTENQLYNVILWHPIHNPTPNTINSKFKKYIYFLNKKNAA